MSIEAISGAASIAAASAIVFMLAARAYQLTAGPFRRKRFFSAGNVREAAQHYREEFQQLCSKRVTYLGAVLVFALLFVASYGLGADRLFPDYPRWQLYLLLAALVTGAAHAGLRLMRNVIRGWRIKRSRDANIVIGHRLQHIATGLGFVFHDVPASEGFIDHLLIGPQGIYAVHVFARRPGKDASVSLVGDELRFAPGNDAASIAPANTRIAELAERFSVLLDRPVRIRSVLAAPGFRVAAQQGEAHLLVNETNLSMLRGWKDPAEGLLNEELDALRQALLSPGPGAGGEQPRTPPCDSPL